MNNNWKIYKGSDDEWEKQLDQSSNSTYLHSNEWSNHLENLGWETRRWVCNKDGNTVALIQGFLKRYPLGIGVLWFPDWIVGDYTAISNIGELLRNSLQLRYLYIRIRSHKEFNSYDIEVLKNNKLNKAKKPFGSGLTMHLDLSDTMDSVRKGLSKNWRRNLKRSKRLESDISLIIEPTPVIDLYEELCNIKGINKLLSSDEISSLMSSFEGKIIVLGAVTPNGTIQAIRGAIVRDNQAIDTFAAASGLARKHYLSYKLCWELLKECKDAGCTDFNFNGIDPINNTGVYNFKKGTGAKYKKMLGEFEWSNNALLRVAIGLVSGKRN